MRGFKSYIAQLFSATVKIFYFEWFADLYIYFMRRLYKQLRFQNFAVVCVF